MRATSAGHRLDHTSFRVFARKPRQPGRTSSSATRPRYGRTITRHDLGTGGRDAGGKTTGARFKLNLISAISPKGQLRFMCTEGNVTADVFIEFLKRLMQGSTRPIFLIVDGHPVHRSAKVRKFVEGLDGKLQRFGCRLTRPI
jgi:hypothetical protein